MGMGWVQELVSRLTKSMSYVSTPGRGADDSRSTTHGVQLHYKFVVPWRRSLPSWRSFVCWVIQYRFGRSDRYHRYVDFTHDTQFALCTSLFLIHPDNLWHLIQYFPRWTSQPLPRQETFPPIISPSIAHSFRPSTQLRFYPFAISADIAIGLCHSPLTSKFRSFPALTRRSYDSFSMTLPSLLRVSMAVLRMMMDFARWIHLWQQWRLS